MRFFVIFGTSQQSTLFCSPLKGKLVNNCYYGHLFSRRGNIKLGLVVQYIHTYSRNSPRLPFNNSWQSFYTVGLGFSDRLSWLFWDRYRYFSTLFCACNQQVFIVALRLYVIPGNTQEPLKICEYTDLPVFLWVVHY